MKYISSQILHFLESLTPPDSLPLDVEVMNPFQNQQAKPYYTDFYKRFYEDTKPRVGLFGINPGRLGAGITGVPFTDPFKLENECGIPNPWDKRTELSSTFVYDVVSAFGGPKHFYEHFYISALSPLGYAQSGKNLNYYDIPNWKTLFESYAGQMITEQLPFLRRDYAYCIGQGENLKFFNTLNDQHHFFDEIIPLPHPRWVMQYRLKRKSEFVEEYLQKLTKSMLTRF